MRVHADADRRARAAAIAATGSDPGLRTVPEPLRSFACDAHDLRNATRTITSPTLRVWGHHDPVIPLRAGHWPMGAIPGTELAVFDRDHRSRTTDPDGVAARLSPFCRQSFPRPCGTDGRRLTGGRSMTAAHRFRSSLLGAPARLDLSHGPIEVFSRGEGPAIVFAHGWLANANLWRGAIDRLADRFRCVALDLPLGAHRVVANPDACLDAVGCAEIIAGAIEALDLRQVTLVGNDSGRAYSPIALSRDPDHVARLVLTSCETPYDEFPPKPFDNLHATAQHPETLRQLLTAVEDPAVRSLPAAFGLLVKHALDPAISEQEPR
jgi:pimeloyl-ACP methyl ester carboxylesterase